ncbi:MAG: protein-disulfide reductase DsbD domain-containing protein [Pseudomonadota bacterium]
MVMIRCLSFTAGILLTGLGLLPATPANAQVMDLDDIVEVRLLEGWRQGDGQHMAAVEIRMAPGWKTYWRSPGDGGVPTIVHLDTGDRVQMHWPRPEVFYTGGMRSIGYAEDVILPIQVSLPQGQQMVSGRIELGICQDVCMPVELSLDAVLPGDGRPDPRIVTALSDQPLSAAEAGIGDVLCRIRPIADGLQLEAWLPMPEMGGGEEVVFELPDPSIWISDPETTRDGAALVAVADIVPADASPFAFDRSELRITVLGRREAIEIQGCSAG